MDVWFFSRKNEILIEWIVRCVDKEKHKISRNGRIEPNMGYRVLPIRIHDMKYEVS